MKYSLLALPLISGCFGVYAEVAATRVPSTENSGVASGAASAIGFNVGGDFSSSRMRFALGYASQTTSLDGGSGHLGVSSSRFDFTVFSVTDRARIRLGVGFEQGSGESTVGGMTTKEGGGGTGFVGLDVSYFLTWKLALHAIGGPAYFTQGVPDGHRSGTGTTFRLTASYTFGDLRPNTHFFTPLDDDHDMTGLLETGAQSMGCKTSRDSNASSGYAFLHVTCQGRSVAYMQVAQGIESLCINMFRKECERFTTRLTDATKATLRRDSAPPPPTPAPSPAAPPPAPAPVAPAPAPAPAPPAAETPPPPATPPTGTP